MALARVTTKGQVTIPAEVRKALDIGEGDDLLFEVVEAGEARIRVLKRRRLSDLYGVTSGHTPLPWQGGGSNRGGPGSWGAASRRKP